jgi:hypothetical protein
MTAADPTADIAATSPHVAFVPITDMGSTASEVRGVPLFDHLVGARKQSRRHVKAERLGGLQIEDELELGCPHHWKAAGCLPLEDAAGSGHARVHLDMSVKSARNGNFAGG